MKGSECDADPESDTDREPYADADSDASVNPEGARESDPEIHAGVAIGSATSRCQLKPFFRVSVAAFFCCPPRRLTGFSGKARVQSRREVRGEADRERRCAEGAVRSWPMTQT